MESILNEKQENGYKWFKESRNHVFILDCSPFLAGEFVNLELCDKDFKEKVIKKRCVAKLNFY